MSYKSAGPDIYDPTIRALIDAKVPWPVIVEVSDRLITNLQNDDWDTERNSLELFAEYPEIVRSFERHGIHLPSSSYLPLGKEEFDILSGYTFRSEDWDDEEVKSVVPELPIKILANSSAYADEIRRLRRLCEENGIAWD